jgi:hypothetical protein
MLKSIYDTDNDGIVDKAERVEIIVRNSTGSTLTKGQIVYLSGATGNRPNAVLADASDEATSSKTIGMVVANILNNADGNVAVSGTLHDLNTNSFADGDTLWLSETPGGMVANTPPAEPAHAVFIGYVARAHPTQGRIVLAIQNGYELNELHGVLISSPVTGHYLYFNGTLWINSASWQGDTIAVPKGGTGFASYAIGDLLYADTTTSLAKLAGVAAGSVLISGTTPSWSNSPEVRAILFDNATNSNIITLNTGATAANYTLTLPTAAPAANQYLQFSAAGVATWVNGTVTGVTTVGTFSASAQTNGATISGSTITFGPASATVPGMVSTGTQIWAGAKTLSSGLTISATTNQLVLGTTNTTTITSPAPTASRVYTIPDAGTTASFVMTAANQTIAGNKTFSAATTFSLAGSLGNAITLSGNGDSTNAAIKFTGAQPRWIDYGNAGGSAPSLVSRSDGTKIVLANVFAAGTFTDFAIGMTSNSIWTGCANNTASYGFEWYGGSTLAMTLKGDGNLTLVGNLTIPNSKNIVLGTGAGTKIGTATNQLLGFHNSTPTVQRASASQAAVATTTPTLAAYGYTLAQATAIITLVNEIRDALVEKGLIKGSA